MNLFLAGLATILGSGAAALAAGARGLDRTARLLATAGMIAGAAVAGLPAVRVLGGAPPLASRAAWSIPGGSFSLGIDRLSAFFVVTILAISAAAAVYGAGYLAAFVERPRKKALGPALFFLNALACALCLVATARNGLLFLVAWELMTVFAFFLVCFEDEHEEVRAAGRTYLLITHVATLFVIAFFLLLGRAAGSLDFDRIAAAPARLPAGTGDILFALAVIGFGTKTGIWPLHSWLPEAHPAAPTHVSAVMSGVIVKTAVYGAIRGISLLGAPPPRWGIVLVAIGGVSAVLGVLYAIAQHDLKRLLAYHTIENIGIIFLGAGMGLLGVACGQTAVAVLGFAGAVLHCLNHALFKALLFFGAGAVIQATGTREIERLGGLARTMPWTAATFLVASVAIAGLPPLNGFVSEWLIYAGFLRAGIDLSRTGALVALASAAVLALTGGLAAACFAKAFGVVFQGAGRSEATARAVECRPLMRAPMLALAAACGAIGLCPAAAGGIVLPIAADLARCAPEAARAAAAGPLAPLEGIGRAAAVIAAAAIALALSRLALLRGRAVGAAPTWGCGYGEATARMQYTASSFAEPLLRLARPVLQPHIQDRPPRGLFPVTAARRTHTRDLVEAAVLRPAAAGVAWALTRARALQQGRIQLYLLYLFITVLLLLGFLWS